MSRRVLVVEDDRDHAELIRRNLRGDDEIYILSDGADALEYLFKKSKDAPFDTPDLILLDVRLPTVNGIDVLKKLKRDPRSLELGIHRIPVVIISTSDESSDQKDAYDNYTNSYLIKPDSLDGWRKMMNKVDEYWFDFNSTV